MGSTNINEGALCPWDSLQASPTLFSHKTREPLSRCLLLPARKCPLALPLRTADRPPCCSGDLLGPIRADNVSQFRQMVVGRVRW